MNIPVTVKNDHAVVVAMTAGTYAQFIGVSQHGIFSLSDLKSMIVEKVEFSEPACSRYDVYRQTRTGWQDASRKCPAGSVDVHPYLEISDPPSMNGSWLRNDTHREIKFD